VADANNMFACWGAGRSDVVTPLPDCTTSSAYKVDSITIDPFTFELRTIGRVPASTGMSFEWYGTRTLPTSSNSSRSTLVVATTVSHDPGRTASIATKTASPGSGRPTSSISGTVAISTLATMATAPVPSWATATSPRAAVNTSTSPSDRPNETSLRSYASVLAYCFFSIFFVAVLAGLYDLGMYLCHWFRGPGRLDNSSQQTPPAIRLRPLAPNSVSTQNLLAAE